MIPVSKILPYGKNTPKILLLTPSVIAVVKFMTIHTGQHNSVWIFQRPFGFGGLRTRVVAKRGRERGIRCLTYMICVFLQQRINPFVGWILCERNGRGGYIYMAFQLWPGILYFHRSRELNKSGVIQN